MNLTSLDQTLPRTPQPQVKYTLACWYNGDEAIWAEGVEVSQAEALLEKAKIDFERLEDLREKQLQLEEEDPKARPLSAQIAKLEEDLAPYTEGVDVILTDPESNASWTYVVEGWEVFEEGKNTSAV